MRFTQRKMCAECPFRAAAAPGWLGPYSVEELAQAVHMDGELACHVDVKKQHRKHGEDADVSDVVQHCVGMLRYQRSVCKIPQNADQAAAGRRLVAIPDVPLIPPGQFQAHHSQKGYDAQHLPHQRG